MFVTSPTECYVSECDRGTSQARHRADKLIESRKEKEKVLKLNTNEISRSIRLWAFS